jgi:hypothetical protein
MAVRAASPKIYWALRLKLFLELFLKLFSVGF